MVRVSHIVQKSLTEKEHHAWALELWNRIDRDKSTTITRDELMCDEIQQVLRQIIAPKSLATASATYGRSELNVEQALQLLMRKADCNGDGVLSFDEFEAFLIELRNSTGAASSASLVFALFDLDGNQLIDKEEFLGIYRYFLGHRPTFEEFEEEWVRLDRLGEGQVTKEQYVKYLQTSKNPTFKQHAPPVIMSKSPTKLDKSSSTPVLASESKRSGKGFTPKKIFRPAPGILPPRLVKPDAEDKYWHPWNERWGTKDPSEENIALRGNKRFKSFFSSPQSVDELRRFYSTYSGFEKNRQRLLSPEAPLERKPILSDESILSVRLPGFNRHVRGGSMRNGKGETVPWMENTPRALKKQVWEPGTLHLRVPVPPPAWMMAGKDGDS
mmetsp:Transcript_15493/g.32692  ORF Transcript_15493/g.32692 Transcript_15493/m.32692 type:complete len:385 (-) Transcript_15493:94-1248(-)